jgi:hypothetical protein
MSFFATEPKIMVSCDDFIDRVGQILDSVCHRLTGRHRH